MEGISDPFALGGQQDPAVAAVQARVDAILAEFDVPLPEGDAGLVEAARRLREIDLRCHALYHGFEISAEIEEAEIIGRLDPLRRRFDDFLIETTPQTLAGAAVMLRHALGEHRRMLLNGSAELVANVLVLVERESAGSAGDA